VVLDVGGVGFRASCTPGCAAGLRLGESAVLHTSMLVRDDGMTLYAFAAVDERDAFDLVRTVSGVGPKIALATVSVLSPDKLRAAIAGEDLNALTQIPGIGKKSAQRIVLDLRDKVAQGFVAPGPGPALLWREQVLAGLQGLGWSAKDAEAACERVAPAADADPAPSVAQLMRAALQSLAK
jgi:Holliday junction DNA helicase RuvA